MSQLTKEELKSQLDILKTEYIKLLNDQDVLLNWGKPQLEALYTTRIGYLQIKKLQLQLRIKALKRKREMVQSAINKNIAVDVMDIELQVAAELADAEHKIMQECNKIEQAKSLLSNLHSPQRSSELRTLFRQFAKQLHPDANPDLTDEQRQIWYMVKDAYEMGDLEKLKAMQLIYEQQLKAANAAEQELNESELLLKIAVLKQGCIILNEALQKIRTEFPFNIETQIKDDEWIAEQQEKVNAEIVALQQYETELTVAYQELIATL